MATKKRAAKRTGTLESEAWVVAFTNDGYVSVFDKMHPSPELARRWAKENGWTKRVGGEVIHVRITEVIK